MASRFENCVRAIKGISREQVQEVLAGYEAHIASGKDAAAAAMEASAFDLWKKQQARAQLAEQALKWNDLVQRAEAHPEGFAVGARAVLMADKYGKGGVAAENVIGAYRGLMHAKFVAGIDAYRSKAGGLSRDVPGLVSFVRALYGENADATATAAATGWRAATDFGADEFIAKGGALAKREDWRLPNPPIKSERVRAAGQEAYSKYLHDAYDRGDLRLIDYDTGQPADPVKAGVIIAKAVSTAITDGLDDMVPGARGGTKVANQRTARRVLEWTTADAWLDANRKWGAGDAGIWDTITHHIDGMATDIGLMHALGPNPAGMTKMLADEVKRRGGSSWDQSVIQGAYDHLSGKISSPVHEWVAVAQRQLGALHTGSKLLSSPISAIGDISSLEATALWNGVPAGRMLGDFVKAFGPGGHLTRKDAIAFGLEADFWINRAYVARRDGAELSGQTFLERSADFLLRASFANVQANNARAVFQLGFLRELADQAGRPLDKMRGRLQKALGRAGITADEWDLIRTQGVIDLGRHSRIYPEQLLQTGDRATIDAGVKLMALINREQDFAQVMGDLRTDMAKTLGTQAGTAAGFATREFMRFKSYSIGLIVTHLNRAMLETEGWGGRLGYGLGLGVAMTFLGAISMQMRMIQAGKDPRDMWSASFWGAAALQGGGLGLFGDFIKSGISRTGGDFASAVAGPTVGLLNDAVKITLGNAGEAGEGKNTNWGREAVRFLRNHTPGSNLWYARRAIDGYLWDYLQTQLDPNYRDAFRRLEQKARKDFDQAYWWKPGGFGPDRAPDLGAALGR